MRLCVFDTKRNQQSSQCVWGRQRTFFATATRIIGFTSHYMVSALHRMARVMSN
ncbi:hypothetical protein CC86DRAFT_366432 [Ophiobolus disseminans]|uniref:Uncharacterized protein n=1 Tax=Ophiobolus disseminans TaxID=1469910 RepID=A0A6A7AI07_9PLEO|nr:hypothetical protein CC86DRAFT_366432 [Ophiobolus disseminans]